MKVSICGLSRQIKSTKVTMCNCLYTTSVTIFHPLQSEYLPSLFFDLLSMSAHF